MCIRDRNRSSCRHIASATVRVRPSAPRSAAAATARARSSSTRPASSPMPHSAASNSTSASRSRSASLIRSASTEAAASCGSTPYPPASISAGRRSSVSVSVHCSTSSGPPAGRGPEVRSTPGMPRTRSLCRKRLRSRPACPSRWSRSSPGPPSSASTAWTSGGSGVEGCRRPVRSPLSAAIISTTTGWWPGWRVPRDVQGSGVSRASPISAVARPSSTSTRAGCGWPRISAIPSAVARAAIRSAVDTGWRLARSLAVTASVSLRAAPPGPCSHRSW